MRRLAYLDNAKALGMILVYYGHFTGRLYAEGSFAAYPHYKSIYAFHMPLFFVLAGVFWRPGRSSVGQVCCTKAMTRIVPVFFFAALSLPVWLLFSHASLFEIAGRTLDYLSGAPELSWPTWFLVCLFSLEVGVQALHRWVRLDRAARCIGCILGLYAGGYLLTFYGDALAAHTGIKANFWFINESVIAAAFFLAGYAGRRWFLDEQPAWLNAAATLVGGLILFLTFDLNTGPFLSQHAVVLMTESSHGHPLLFPLTAIGGVVFLTGLARAIELPSLTLRFVGRNTLIYLGLSGLCMHHLDYALVGALPRQPGSQLAVLALAGMYTAVVILLFAPLVIALRRVAPELVNLPWHEASWLPPLGAHGSSRRLRATVQHPGL